MDDINIRVSVLETKLEVVLPTLATKSDVGSIESKIADVRGDIKGWMLATVLTIIGVLAAFMFGMFTLHKPAQQTAQQPIVIQLPAQQPVSTPTPPASPQK